MGPRTPIVQPPIPQTSPPTLDWPVVLSLAKYMREMEPKGRKSSWRSVSRVSSDRLVTRMVALSSALWAGQGEVAVRSMP